VWSWASVISESTAAVFLGLLAAVSTRRRALRFCAGVVLFLSLDDFIRIHERIVHIRRHLPGALGESLFPHAVRTLWPVIYLPLLAVLFVLLWRIAQGFATPERVAIRGSLLALVVAVALEVGTPLLFAIGQGDGSPGYEVEVAIEESLELAGWMWIAAGLAMGLLRSIGDDGRADATTSQPGLAQRPAGTQETGAGLPQDRGV